MKKNRERFFRIFGFLALGTGLLLIGLMLVLEGVGTHVGKGYIYFAMAFSLGVEMLNLRLRARTIPLHLRQSYVDE